MISSRSRGMHTRRPFPDFLPGSHPLFGLFVQFQHAVSGVVLLQQSEHKIESPSRRRFEFPLIRAKEEKLAGFAEVHRSDIVERTQRDYEDAARRAVPFSPMRKITPQQIEIAGGLLDKGYTADQAGEAVGISSTSVNRLVINQ